MSTVPLCWHSGYDGLRSSLDKGCDKLHPAPRMSQGGHAMQNLTNARSEKRLYTTPRLMVHGTLEELTKQQDKNLGPTDGFTFQGVAITNVS